MMLLERAGRFSISFGYKVRLELAESTETGRLFEDNHPSCRGGIFRVKFIEV